MDLRWDFVGDTPAPPAEERLIYPSDPETPTFTWVWLRLDGGLRSLVSYQTERLEFVVDPEGRAVRIAWGADTDVSDAVPYLLGTMMGFVLRQRGLSCLHAGAVGIDGRAVVLVGPSGTGKSSTVAALAERGHSVLTDDTAVIDDTESGLQVRPAYPSIRLRPDYVEAATGSADGLPRLWSEGNRLGFDRRVADLTTGSRRFQRDPLPPAAIVVLGPRTQTTESPSLDRLAPIAGTLALVANMHVGFVISQEAMKREWAFLGTVANSVPTYRLDRPDSLAALPQICDLIEQTVRLPPRLPDSSHG